MGYTHFDKVSGATGLGVGANGAEIVVADSSGNLYQAGVVITATAAEINALGSGGLSAVELGVLDSVTPGTATASKAVVLGASKDIATITSATITTLTSTTVNSAALTGTTTCTMTSANAAALAVGLAGATNPAFVVDSSTGSQAAGLKVTGATAAGTVAAAVISSGADASLTINAKGTGTIGIGSVSTGAVTITPATTVTGAVTPTGGVAAAGGFSVSPRLLHTGGLPARINTDGTNATPVNTEVYIGEVFVPANCTITGVAVFNGTDVTDNIKVGLADSAGAVVATSASTAGSGADAYQRVPFTGTYAAKGPATYYVLSMYAASTSRYNAHTFGNFGASKQTGQVFATGFTTITPPTTFTADLANIASLY